MFNKYKSATGAVLDSSTGFLRITSAQYAALQPLEFVIGGRSFALPPNGQIWPRSLNTIIPGGVVSILVRSSFWLQVLTECCRPDATILW